MKEQFNSLTEEILGFIHRRFNNDSNWLNGNCYYFAIILKERFAQYDPEIFYDRIEGHFLCKIKGIFFDWSGCVTYTEDYEEYNIVKWSSYHNEDELHWNRIVRDVIL